MITGNVRSLVRVLILEAVTEGQQQYKMIFLAGLPGSGKSTLLEQLGIDQKFTTCNIDKFFEPMMESELGTMNLEIPADRRRELKAKKKEALEMGVELSSSDIAELLDLEEFDKKQRSLFQMAIQDFNVHVADVCRLGANFIVDGTAARSQTTMKKAKRYEAMGYECAMIFVDIDTETSKERNTARGARGKRAIDSRIIGFQGKDMPGNIPIYEEFFGENFFLVSNRGTFEEYQDAIEQIRPGVEAFMGN